MIGTQHKSVDSEIDLGVSISSSLKPSQQCSDIVNKPNKIIGFNRKIIWISGLKLRCSLYIILWSVPNWNIKFKYGTPIPIKT